VRAVTEPTERLPRLAQELQERVNTWRLAPVVEALQALRGVQFTVAVTTVAARGDLTRLTNPEQLLRDLGLTPSEDSSGPRRSQGGLTKTGESHARRALIEGAWAYRYPAKLSRHLQRRLEPLPNPLQDLSWQAQVRLGKRSRQRMARGKHATPVRGARARARLAWRWAMATEGPLRPAPRALSASAPRRDAHATRPRPRRRPGGAPPTA
jgi:transposase